ncbi:hypothetical protein A8B79_15795 [Balneola sp. EhC07]|nr:hypothetical protein A8B79_15795 [Balneola sp. EhC07]
MKQVIQISYKIILFTLLAILLNVLLGYVFGVFWDVSFEGADTYLLSLNPIGFISGTLLIHTLMMGWVYLIVMILYHYHIKKHLKLKYVLYFLIAFSAFIVIIDFGVNHYTLISTIYFSCAIILYIIIRRFQINLILFTLSLFPLFIYWRADSFSIRTLLINLCSLFVLSVIIAKVYEKNINGIKTNHLSKDSI